MRARGGIRPLAGMLGAGFVGVVLVMALVSDGGHPALRGCGSPRPRTRPRPAVDVAALSARGLSASRQRRARVHALVCFYGSDARQDARARALDKSALSFFSLDKHLSSALSSFPLDTQHALFPHQGRRERCSSCTEGIIPSRCTWETGEPTTRPSGAATTQTAISEMLQRTRRRHTFSKVLDTVTLQSKYNRTLTLQNLCQAYADPSPLAIINDNYKEGQLNPFPGPKNFGPDSPMIWLDAEADDLGLGTAHILKSALYRVSIEGLLYSNCAGPLTIATF